MNKPNKKINYYNFKKKYRIYFKGFKLILKVNFCYLGFYKIFKLVGIVVILLFLVKCLSLDNILKRRTKPKK